MTTNFYINGKQYSARFVTDTAIGTIYIEKPTKTAILHKKNGDFATMQIPSYVMDDVLDNENEGKQYEAEYHLFSEFKEMLENE